MIITDLAQYLEDNNIGTVGTDLYVGELPLDKNNCIALVYSPSPEPDKSIPYYDQTIDIWARFSSYEDGYNMLQTVFDLIHRAENYQMGGWHIYLSYANGLINDNGRDVERRHLFQLTLTFVYRESDIS